MDPDYQTALKKVLESVALRGGMALPIRVAREIVAEAEVLGLNVACFRAVKARSAASDDIAAFSGMLLDALGVEPALPDIEEPEPIEESGSIELPEEEEVEESPKLPEEAVPAEIDTDIEEPEPLPQEDPFVEEEDPFAED